jgi:hypothetical protein
MKNNKILYINESLQTLSQELNCTVQEIVELLSGNLISEEEANAILSLGE